MGAEPASDGHWQGLRRPVLTGQEELKSSLEAPTGRRRQSADVRWPSQPQLPNSFQTLTPQTPPMVTVDCTYR